MNDFQLKVLLTSLSAVVFSLIFVMLALVLPVGSSKSKNLDADPTDTRFEKMSQSMKDGFK